MQQSIRGGGHCGACLWRQAFPRAIRIVKDASLPNLSPDGSQLQSFTEMPGTVY